MTFGQKLRILRQDSGYSQEQLGEILKVSHQTISKYEQNSINPSLEKIHLIVEVFDISYNQLLDDEVELIIKEEASEEAVATTQSTTDETEITEQEEATTDHRLNVYSQITEQQTAYYKFEVGSMVGPKHDWKPEAYLAGIDHSSWFGDNKTTLAYYRTIEEAQQELAAIHEAMNQEQSAYELQYSVPVKRRGLFGVQMDEE